MYKNIPHLFFILLCVASCAHSNFDDHFQESTTGWTQQKIYKKFGKPSETFEDSDFKYYVYQIAKAAKLKNAPPVLWNVRYVFENNKVVDVIEERVPTASELDELEAITKEPVDKSSQFKPL